MLGSAAGLMLISQLVPFGRQVGIASVALIGLAVGAAGNMSGRILSGWMSDTFGRVNTLRLMMFISAVAMPLLYTFGANVLAFSIGVFVVYYCFGTLLSVFAATSADFFGTKYLGMNYGLLFLAWGSRHWSGRRSAPGYTTRSATTNTRSSWLQRCPCLRSARCSWRGRRGGSRRPRSRRCCWRVEHQLLSVDLDVMRRPSSWLLGTSVLWAGLRTDNRWCIRATGRSIPTTWHSVRPRGSSRSRAITRTLSFHPTGPVSRSTPPARVPSARICSWKNLNDDSPPRSVIRLEAGQLVTQWPSDTLIVFEQGAGLRDLWVVNLSDPDSARAKAYLTSEATVWDMVISPDGTLAAYSSNESGQFEIYIRSFPTPGERTIV